MTFRASDTNTGLDRHSTIQYSCVPHRDYTCKTATGLPVPVDQGDQRYTSAETCLVDKVSSFIPQTQPTHSPIPSHPLITHTHVLKRQERKFCCVCRIEEQHTLRSE